MHAVVHEEAGFGALIWIDKDRIDIEVVCGELARDLLQMPVGVLDNVVADPFHIRRQDALHHDCCFFIPGRQIAHDFSIGFGDVVLLHGDIVDAGHEEDEVRVIDRCADPLPPVQQSLDRLPGNAEIGHPVFGEPFLPVEPLGQ